MSTFTQVNYTVDDRIARIELDGPHKLNAIADETSYQLKDALFRFDLDESADVAIIHGAGRAFCSGADVGQRQLRPPEEIIALGGPQGRDTQMETYFFHFSNTKPLIAAVHGYATGYGFLIAMLCDLMIAEEETKFQITEVARGLGGSHLRALLYERGAGRIADDLSLTGRFCLAPEGLDGGFVHRVVPAGERLEAAVAAAKEIMANPPLSVRAMVAYRRSHIEAAWLEGRSNGPRGLHLTEDFRESASAFMEKRTPHYVGR